LPAASGRRVADSVAAHQRFVNAAGLAVRSAPVLLLMEH
jgi:hypothetical protein